MSILLFATHNPGKIVELEVLLADFAGLEVRSLKGLDVPDVVEDAPDFLGNAMKKAMAVSDATGLPALADDSGLEVDALGGAPGVFSARYAGRHGDNQANNDKLVAEMAGQPQRSARFRSALAFADTKGPLGNRCLTAEGACEGEILDAPRGDGGFGYDPLFFCPELGMTFAEAGTGPKNQISHRARAMKEMIPQLTDYFALKPSE